MLRPNFCRYPVLDPAKVLNNIGIDPVHVNEDVGQNLQDHAGPPMAWRMQNEGDSVNKNLTPLGLIGSVVTIRANTTRCPLHACSGRRPFR